MDSLDIPDVEGNLDVPVGSDVAAGSDVLGVEDYRSSREELLL